jgi:hypothetical protein
MPNLDIPKLVGAASAPVALIIATSIFLSNLGAKYALLSGFFRDVSNELRRAEDRNSLRSKSVEEQVKMYSHRLRILMRATFWLTASIICFILTVALTGVTVMYPNARVWQVLTALFSYSGMSILAASVGLEMWENREAKRVLLLETSEFPNILSDALEDQKHQFRDQLRETEVKASEVDR